MGPGAALHVVAGLQAETADLGDGEIDILGAGVVVVHAKESVAVGQHLQHTLHRGAVFAFQHPGHSGVGGAVFLVVVGLLLLTGSGRGSRGCGAIDPRLLAVLVHGLIALVRIAALAVVVAKVTGVALLVAVVLPAVLPAALILLLRRFLLRLRLWRLLGRSLRLLLCGDRRLLLLRGRFRFLLRLMLDPLPGILLLGLALSHLALLLGRLRLLTCSCLGRAAPLLWGGSLTLRQHFDQLVFPVFAYVFHAQSLRHRTQLCQVLFLQVFRSHSLPPMLFNIV